MLEPEDVSLLVLWGVVLAVPAAVIAIGDAIFYHRSLWTQLFVFLLTILTLAAYLAIRRHVVRTVDRYVEGVALRIVAELRESQQELRTELLGELQEARQELLAALQDMK